jgi:hypothetical protein
MQSWLVNYRVGLFVRVPEDNEAKWLSVVQSEWLFALDNANRAI